MKEHGRSQGLGGFAAENGWFLLGHKVVGASVRRLRDATIARRLRTSGLKMGRTPHLRGLGHCKVGVNLSAGHNLWLEAVTSFAGKSFEPELTIGDDCNLSDQVHIGCVHRVSIGSGLLCGSRVLIIDHAHGVYGAKAAAAAGGVESDPAVRPNLRPLSAGGEVWIGRNVWIGDGAVILAGAWIGDGAIIGANSVVNGVVPAETVAAGAPVRLLRRWDRDQGAWIRLSPE